MRKEIHREFGVVSAVLPLMFLAVAADAAPEQQPAADVSPAIGRHITRTVGVTAGHNLPFHTKMRGLLNIVEAAGPPNLERRPVAEMGLSTSDARIVSELARRERTLVAKARAASVAELRQLCAALLADQMDVLAFGAKLNEVDRRESERLDRTYSTALTELSTPGRIALDRYLDDVVASSINRTQTDYESMFAEHPAAFAATMKERCAETGAASPTPVTSSQQNAREANAAR